MKPSDSIASLFRQSPKTGGRTSTRLIFFISIALAILLLYLTLYGLDWKNFFTTLRHAHYEYLFLIFVWASIANLMRAMRWRVLLLSEKPIPLSDSFWAYMAGYMGNNLLPARAGELIRSGYLGKIAGISMSFVLATCLVERFMDVIALLILGSVSLISLGVITRLFEYGFAIMVALGLAGFFFLLFLPRFGGVFRKFIDVMPALKPSGKARLQTLLENFMRGLQSMSDLTKMVLFSVVTGIIWSMNGVGMVITAMVFQQHMSFSQALILLASLGLSRAIPSTPGSIGIVQFVAVTVLSPLGFTRENALALIIVAQGMEYITVIFWGVLALWMFSRKVAKSML